MGPRTGNSSMEQLRAAGLGTHKGCPYGGMAGWKVMSVVLVRNSVPGRSEFR